MASKLFTQDEIEALRRIALWLRAQGVDSVAIYDGADVEKDDFNNFIRIKSGRGTNIIKYFSNVPSDIFLQRLAYFVWSDKYMRALIEKSNINTGDSGSHTLHDDYVCISEHVRSNSIYFNNGDDTLSRVLSLKFIFRENISSLEAFSEKVSGNYYSYRYAGSHPNKIVKSHISVKKYSVYNRVPAFEINRLVTDQIKTSRGFVYSLPDQLLFAGSVVDKAKHPMGMHIMILPVPSNIYKYRGSNGIFCVRNGDSSYDFGAIVVVETRDEFLKEKTGTFSLGSIDTGVQLEIERAWKAVDGDCPSRQSLKFNY